MKISWTSLAHGAKPLAICASEGAISSASAAKFKMGGVVLLALAFAEPARSIGQTCDELADYSVFDSHYTLNANHEYHVNANITWSTALGFNNMNIRGSIIVEPNKTLTIDGATIRFADSRHMAFSTNIIVKPGADLVLKNGAVLTTLASCPGSMWDGIRVLGIPSHAEDLGINGVVQILASGGTIRNAIVGILNCQVADIMDPTGSAASNGGGVVIALGGRFYNNRYGVVLRQYNSQMDFDYTNTRFFNCQFWTTAWLNYGSTFEPKAFLYFDRVNRMKVGQCFFSNINSSADDWETNRGEGIHAFNTQLQCLPLCNGVWDAGCAFDPGTALWNFFQGLNYGINVQDIAPNKAVDIRYCDVSYCAGGIKLSGVAAATVNSNSISQTTNAYPPPDGLNMVYGLGMWNCTGYDVQQNAFTGGDPAVCLVVSNSGPNQNTVYNNTFHFGYTGSLFGTIVQLNNDGPGQGDGLVLKCNDYQSNSTNYVFNYDIAITGPNPTIGDRQGSPPTDDNDVAAPAGNTFTDFCLYPDATNVSAPSSVNPFTYWYHDPNSTSFKVFPSCHSADLDATNTFVSTTVHYNKIEACPSMLNMFDGGAGQRTAMLSAEQEFNTLKQVYDAQRDGGNTEGLKQTVGEPGHSSYEVRNALMMAAPKVSIEVWKEVFGRDPAMNPWHMAQALLANSPLQPEVVRMLEESDLAPFYKQLVAGGQGNGVSTLTIYESEMSHYGHLYERALNALAHDALMSEEPNALDDVLAWEGQHPQLGQPVDRVALLLQKGDPQGAKAVIDAQLLTEPADAGMEVLDMYVGLLIDGQSIEGASTEQIARLQAIAAQEGAGQAQAQAWLEHIGEGHFIERIYLPEEDRALHPSAVSSTTGTTDVLRAYPNPSSGKDPVYLVAHLPEGVEKAYLRVMTPLGQLISEESVGNSTTVVEVAAKDLSAGFYTAGLFAEGLQLATLKFEIVR